MNMVSSGDADVKELFELLSKTASNNSKRDILFDNKENEHFKLFLNYLLNPFLITGISEKKVSKQPDKPPTKFFDSFVQLMEYLLQNNTGTDEIISNIRHFLSVCETAMQDFYSSIITKNARIGCDAKSVNKAFGIEFIPLWDVQQSYNIEKYPLKQNEWFSLSEKLNGVRGTYFEGKMISRQGKEFHGLEHITGDIGILFSEAENWVLDGELVRENREGLSDNENFRIGTGLLSQDDADKSSMQFVVFDILPKDEFVCGESVLSYKDRLELLKTTADRAVGLGLRSISIVTVLYTGSDDLMIDKLLDKMISEDKEGLMLNRDSKYYRKRHSGILKVKRFYTVDLKVTAIEEGSGRLRGTLGAFVVDYKGNNLNVGSGMTDKQRKDFWQSGPELIGRVIEVKYKEESRDKRTGLLSLQFPIFVSLREEGKQVSYY